MPYSPLTVNDILTWASIRVLVEPVVSTTLGTPVSVLGLNTVTPGSMASIYVGALLIIDAGNPNQEIVTVLGASLTAFSAVFTFTHLGTAAVTGATFPTGQLIQSATFSDALFTQQEMIGYLAEALDDFVLKTYPLYAIVNRSITAGVGVYDTPSDAIRIERISRVDYGILGTAVPNPHGGATVTITPPTMDGISNGTVLLVDSGASFETIVASNVSSTTFDGFFTIAHSASAVLYRAGIRRLWNVSVTDLDNNDPKWQGEVSKPTMYYEDELNVGQYGVAPNPSQGYTAWLWYSKRPVLTTLLSPLLIPDPLAYIPYYGMLARVFRKDGEMRDPQREQYCQRRYDVGVEIVVRLLDGLAANVSPGPVEAAATA